MAPCCQVVEQQRTKHRRVSAAACRVGKTGVMIEREKVLPLKQIRLWSPWLQRRGGRGFPVSDKIHGSRIARRLSHVWRSRSRSERVSQGLFFFSFLQEFQRPGRNLPPGVNKRGHGCRLWPLLRLFFSFFIASPSRSCYIVPSSLAHT